MAQGEDLEKRSIFSLSFISSISNQINADDWAVIALLDWKGKVFSLSDSGENHAIGPGWRSVSPITGPNVATLADWSKAVRGEEIESTL